MRQSIRHILLFLAAITCAAQAFAWGETTSYVLEDNKEYSLSSIDTGPALPLSGPGATLSFEAKRQVGAFIYFYVQQSTDGGNNWTDLANPSLTTSYKTVTCSINPDVTHIRFITKTGATLTKYYKNIKVTRATTLATSTGTLDFGTVTNRSSATLDALIDYNNTTYNQQVTGTCTDPNFTVTPTTVGATGLEAAVPVVFTPTSAGTHTGTVTLKMNDKSVTFQVTGVGQTTYYTRATAVATAGGSAYVSFNSFEEATADNDTKSSEVTTASSASTTAYYRAVPNQRYAFVGWKANLSDATYVSTEANFEAPAYSYSSEDPASPTVKTYYAVFEEKANVITLEPTTTGYDPDLYEKVVLHRTLREGYSTIALPFDTDVQTLTARSNNDDWVAQLHAVTYNALDGYTLYFEKVANGSIAAFQPYVLHLGQEVIDPSWDNIMLTAAELVSITPVKGYGAASSPDGSSSYANWTMTSNFTAGKEMTGLYGVVNAEGGLKVGGTGATLNAYSAYITSPAGNSGNVKVRSFYLDEGELTAIEGIPADRPGYSVDADPSSDSSSCATTIYSIDGCRRSRPTAGINLIRQSDGRVKKVLQQSR